MEQEKWFNRRFHFSNSENIFPSILEMLWGASIRLRKRMELLSANVETPQVQGLLVAAGPEKSWSVLENIGHLIDLEELWQGRLKDIQAGKKYLREWDLENGKTHQAGHNKRELSNLLDEFEEVRTQTIEMLQPLTKEDIILAALHPRLHQPMRITDLFLFVAEHDDHHLARISWLIKRHSKAL